MPWQYHIGSGGHKGWLNGQVWAPLLFTHCRKPGPCLLPVKALRSLIAGVHVFIYECIHKCLQPVPTQGDDILCHPEPSLLSVSGHGVPCRVLLPFEGKTIVM